MIALTKKIKNFINNVHTNDELYTSENYVVIEHDENDNCKLLEIATTLPRALKIRNFHRNKNDAEYPLVNVFKILDDENLIMNELQKFIKNN